MSFATPIENKWMHTFAVTAFSVHGFRCPHVVTLFHLSNIESDLVFSVLCLRFNEKLNLGTKTNYKSIRLSVSQTIVYVVITTRCNTLSVFSSVVAQSTEQMMMNSLILTCSIYCIQNFYIWWKCIMFHIALRWNCESFW